MSNEAIDFAEKIRRKLEHDALKIYASHSANSEGFKLPPAVNEMIEEEVQGIVKLHSEHKRLLEEVEQLSRITVISSWLGLSRKVTKTYGEEPSTALYKPPASCIRAVLEFVFSEKAFETVFAQAILDMREDHAEALAEGRLHKARWIVARDHGSLLLTVAAYLAATVGKKFKGVWDLVPGGD